MWGLPRGLRSRHADALLACVEAASALATAALPEPVSRIDPRDASRRTKGLRKLVSERAESLGMPRELLLQRRLANALLEHLDSTEASDLPPELGGWRYAVIVRDALHELRDQA